MQFDRKLVNGRPKRYLLRLINTAFASTYVFTIDNHYLQVVGADFVPMHNFTATSVLVGIGQRYHVIVEAKLGFPTDNNAENGNVSHIFLKYLNLVLFVLILRGNV